MEKDFDSWNREKKNIHSGGENRYYKEREIWWCSLGLNIGNEQDGAGDHTGRPVLILRGFSKQVCLAIPLTTHISSSKYRIKVGEIDGKEAAVIISQIRLIDTKRFVNRIDKLDETTFESIRKAVRDLI